MSNVSFIYQLLKQKSESNIEFRANYDLAEIAKTTCAYLNADGGWIVIGHSGKEVNGVEDSAEKVSDLQLCFSERISPQPLIDVRIDQFEEFTVILVNIIRGSRQPYSFDGKYFVRRQKETISVDSNDLGVLIRTSNGYDSAWEKMAAGHTEVDDLEAEEIAQTIREAETFGRGKVLPKDNEEFLNYFQLLDNYKVKNGALILFGKHPAKFLPQCRIRITAIPYGKTGSRFSDMLIIEDNLFEAFERVQQYFKKTMPLLSEFQVDNWDRKNRDKYPLEAIDEAIINAMIHRDYGDFSGEITINIYPEKLEIINSGEFPPDIIKGKNKFHEHHSVFRNPLIAHIFWLRNKGEKMGRGLGLIKGRFSEYGLKEPEWTTQSGYTKLTLFGEPIKVDINLRMMSFLRNQRIGERFTRENYEAFFVEEFNEKTARNDISKMVKGAWVKKVGNGPATMYLRTNKELPDIAG